MSLVLRKNLNRKLSITEIDNNFEYLESISSGSLTPTLLGNITYEDFNLIFGELKKVVFADILGQNDKLISLYINVIDDFELSYVETYVNSIFSLNRKGNDIELVALFGKELLMSGEIEVWAVITI